MAVHNRLSNQRPSRRTKRVGRCREDHEGMQVSASIKGEDGTGQPSQERVSPFAICISCHGYLRMFQVVSLCHYARATQATLAERRQSKATSGRILPAAS